MEMSEVQEFAIKDDKSNPFQHLEITSIFTDGIAPGPLKLLQSKY